MTKLSNIKKKCVFKGFCWCVLLCAAALLLESSQSCPSGFVLLERFKCEENTHKHIHIYTRIIMCYMFMCVCVQIFFGIHTHADMHAWSSHFCPRGVGLWRGAACGVSGAWSQ